MSEIQQQHDQHLQAIDSASSSEEYLRALGEFIDWQRAQGHLTAEQASIARRRVREDSPAIV